jgi:hypothetical protein
MLVDSVGIGQRCMRAFHQRYPFDVELEIKLEILWRECGVEELLNLIEKCSQNLSNERIFLGKFNIFFM